MLTCACVSVRERACLFIGGIKLDIEGRISLQISHHKGDRSTTVLPEMAIPNHTFCFFNLAVANSTAPDYKKIYHLMLQPVQK